MKKTLILTLCTLAAVALAAGSAQAATYEVTVTNLTRGQILSPPVVVSHQSGFSLFTPGEPASPELAGLAEDALSEPLLALLATEPQVRDAAIGSDVIMPGDSLTIEVEGQGNFRRLTVVSMLVTTNDAFVAASGKLRTGAGYYGIAWDAGSETNTQNCAHIPGPPCGNPGVRVTGSAEGFVSVHAGIHGGGSLNPRQHDWRNPVASVSVRRVN